MLIVDVLVCRFGFGIQCSSLGARKLGRARKERRNSSRLLCHANYVPTWKVTLLACVFFLIRSGESEPVADFNNVAHQPSLLLAGEV
jgi:hypothetical protein